MKITFHGAARNVTGSKHLLTLDNGTQILLDCGMFQGMGHDTDELNKEFGFNASEVDYLVLSHAHIDHCGLIPRLVAEGFEGKIFCTPATKDLAKILLLDSAKIQESDLKYENRKRQQRKQPLAKPLYRDVDVMDALEQFEVVRYNQEVRICDGVTVQFIDAGHIIGSASVHLSITENGKTTHISFSGDVGRYGDLILKSPQSFPQADILLLESTYGDKLHKDALPAEQELKEIINQTCLIKKGKVIIPAFSVGRTQELLYILNNLELAGQLPPVNYYVDSPLSEKATNIVKSHPEGFNKEVQDVLKHDTDPFAFKGLAYVEDADESKALNTDDTPCVIISASGMADAGRVKHHIKNNISDSKNTILMVGYCEPSSLGGRLKNGATEVSIYGQQYGVIAEVKSIQSMSAHGDYEDLLEFISCQDKEKLKTIFLVHGEYDVQQVFRDTILSKGYKKVEIPDRHQTFEL